MGRTSQKKPNLRGIVSQLMNEKVRYAEYLVFTRGDLFNWLQSRGVNFRNADYLAFGTPAEPEETELTPQSVIDAFTKYLKEGGN